MIASVNKSVYFFVVLSIFLTVIEGEFSHSRKCLKKKGKFPIPGSLCTSFFTCENWKAVREESCPTDQHFNPMKEWCDYKEFYPCLEKPTRKECPKPNGRFLKNGTDCEKYFDCCNGEPTEKKCSKGLLFDATSGKCDYEELVDCEESSKNKDCPKRDGKFLKPGTRCRSYFECNKGKAKEKKCPKHQLFNVKSGKCDWKEKVTCKDKKKEECPKPTGRFLKSGTECKVYLDCYNGKATEKTCSKNQLFDTKAKKCVKKELVTCKDESSSESSSNESSESDESSRETSTPGESSSESSSDESSESRESSSESSSPDSKLTPPATSPETVSERLISDSTTDELKSPLPITDSTTEEAKSPLPVTDSTTEEVESPLPVTDSTTEEVKSPLPVTDTTTEEVESPLPITDSTTEDIESPLPTSATTDIEISYSTHEEITATDQTSDITEITTQTSEIMSESKTQPVITTRITAEPTPSELTDDSSTQEIPTSPTKQTSHLGSSELTSDLTSLSTEEEIINTDFSTESILVSSPSESTVVEITSSTHIPTEDPEVSTNEEISSSYQTQQPSSYGTSETTSEDIYTESEQTSIDTTKSDITSEIVEISSDSTTETDITSEIVDISSDSITETDITSEIVDISSDSTAETVITSEIGDISSDSTTEDISSLETRSEVFLSSTSDAYESTIDPVLVGFVCPEKTGYYPHPTNKRKFIGCVHGNAYIMDCPSNLIYNHEQRRCVYAK